MRPVRSLLWVPAAKRGMVEKAIDEFTAADALAFDLEDSVPPSGKEDARDLLADVLPSVEERESMFVVRVNGPDTGLMEADLDAVVGQGVDAIAVPKLRSPDDVRLLDNYLTYLERVRGIEDKIDIIAIFETAESMYFPYEMATASDRVKMVTGARAKGVDIEHNLGYEWTEEGMEALYLRSKILMAARAAGLEEIISGIWTDIDDVEGLKKDAKFARQLGYTSYQVLHPKQIEPVNEIFSPDPDEIDRCRRIVEVMEEAEAESGQAAVKFEGEMIDIANLRTCERKLERARAFDMIE